ncbi:MAG: tRNA pseudouridine(38-40) synthase TruA [Flavobacteriales bacterium]|nr:tRNA pseudouridine(38-40) synthase TruA [Flavobacteriales bacterium]
MARYFIRLSYDGTNYHGWQIQQNAVTVQEELNNALSTIIEKDISCTGCGRTDAGVHASDFYAHFDAAIISEPFPKLIYKLNGRLPDDIAIHELYRVHNEANARFDAVSRSYSYRIITMKNVFAGPYAYFHYHKVNMDAMNRCGQLLLKHTDFSCFSRSNTQTRTNNCDILDVEWLESEGKLEFRISANRFLRGMVRAIVGTLLEVGAGKISEDDFIKILDGQDRTKAGYSVPARGLFLNKVTYPEGYWGE